LPAGAGKTKPGQAIEKALMRFMANADFCRDESSFQISI